MVLPPANEVWGKVIFLHLSVILFTGGVCLSACWDTTPQDQAPPWSRHTPLHSACWEIRSTSGWYASYWNAILLFLTLVVVFFCSNLVTSMPSSRMHTTRLLPVSPNMHCFWGVGGCLPLVLGGGVCLWSWGGCLPLVPGGLPLVQGGVCIPACTEAEPPLDRMTDRCKNIIFATSFAGGNN